MKNKIIILIILGILSTSCAWKKDFRLGREAFQKKDWDQAVAHFLNAVSEKPDNLELRISLANALISASNYHLNKGIQLANEKQYKLAMAAFEKSLEYNPENNNSRNRKHSLIKHLKELEKQHREKTEIQQLKEKSLAEEIPTPKVKYKKKPYSLKFNKADIKNVLKALEKISGVNFIYDEAFKTKRIAINFEGVEFMEALEKIMLQTKSFYKIIDAQTVMIIPDTPAKRRDYEELVMKTVFISNGDADEIAKTIRSLTGLKTLAVDKDIQTITIKGTPELVKMAERIVSIHDKPKGEAFIDIEIIEVNRARAQQYGIELSQYQLTQTYWPETGDASEPTSSTIRLHRLGHTDASDYLLSLPSINYNLLKTDRNSQIKARPQIRVVDGEKSEVHLGDKVPIPTTSFVPYNVQGPAQQPITSYQLQDIGINIKITPQIHHDGLITMELEFELTFITSPGTERLPPTLGNRTVKTTIKLRDNETSILAGLLRDTERKSLTGIPFLSNVPVLKEIFSGNKNEIEQTDIILTLTPRIIRFPEINESDLELLWVGTQANPGLKSPPPNLELKKDEEEETEESTDADKKAKDSKTEKTTKDSKTKSEKSKKPTASTVDKKSSIESIKTTEKPKEIPQFITFDFSSESLKIKKGNEEDIPFNLSGENEIRAITIEMEFDQQLIQILDVRKGKLLNAEGTKSLLLRNINNQDGKLKLNISMEKPMKITMESLKELMVMRVKPLKEGKLSIKPTLLRIMDNEMKELETKSPKKGLAIDISE